jgi:hypothetical protein
MTALLILLALAAAVTGFGLWMGLNAKSGPQSTVGTAIMFVGVLALLILLALVIPVRARDDGRYAKSPLKPWFDSLKSSKGPCCSDADGTALSDVDWEAKDGHYRVRIEDKWWNVPDEAIITEPNLVGRTMVWPVLYRADGKTLDRVDIRCFMPGSMI